MKLDGINIDFRKELADCLDDTVVVIQQNPAYSLYNKK